MTSPEVDAESQSTASERREGASTSCQSDKDSVVLPSPSSSASISSVISLDASSEQFSSVEPVADEIREKWTAAENEAMRDKPLHDEDVFEVDLDYASSEDLPSVEQVGLFAFGGCPRCSQELLLSFRSSTAWVVDGGRFMSALYAA